MDYELLVDGHHLREGAKLFDSRFKVRGGHHGNSKATVAFANGFVLVNALDRGFVARATGLWPGIARTSASLWVALAKVPVLGDEIRIRFVDGRLKIGPMAMEADWLPVSQSLLTLAGAPDWIGGLALKYRVPPPGAKGRAYAVEIANAERNLSQLIDRAVKPLLPFGVTADDIGALVQRRLKERWGLPPDKAA